MKVLLERLQTGDWEPFEGFDVPCLARVVEAAHMPDGSVRFTLERKHYARQ